MDPVTHAVIGLAASKLVGNGTGLTGEAAFAITIGSVFPDVDILLQKWGDYVYLKHHRGASHSFFGIIISSMIIAAVLGGFFGSANLASLFLWSLAGCLSHCFFDIFNPYGAKLLWPFYNKKISLGLLIVFDPIVIGLLAGYAFTNGNMQNVFLGLFIVYIIIRSAMKLYVKAYFRKESPEDCKKVSVIPSMTGLLRWHFVAEGQDNYVVGEKNIIKRNYKIINVLQKPETKLQERAMITNVGKFFREFTPLYHIGCEDVEGATRYTFTDMRYYVRNNFLHHAVLEMDKNDAVLKASFNPYSTSRSCYIP